MTPWWQNAHPARRTNCCRRRLLAELATVLQPLNIPYRYRRFRSFSMSETSRPFTITGVVTKKNVDSKLGLSFKNSKKRVVIHQVKGRFQQQTDFVPGLTILSVNGVPIDSAGQAAMLIRSYPSGNIIVVSNGQVFKATKLRRKQKSGLGITQMKDGTGVKITSVEESGMFPTIPPGSYLHAINGKRVTHISDCVKWLKQKRKLTVVVVEAPAPAAKKETKSSANGNDPTSSASTTTATSAPSTVQSTAEEPNNTDDDQDSQFNDSHEGGSQASSFWSKSEYDDKSKYSSSNWDGSAGGSVRSAWDDNRSHYLDFDEDLLLDSVEQLRELAKDLGQASDHHATRIVASLLVAPEQVANCGVILEQKSHYLFLKEVDPTGPFGKTSLKAGQCLLRINGKVVAGGTPLEEATAMLKPMELQKGDGDSDDESDDDDRRRFVIETMQGWGTPSQEPQHVLMQVDKPRPAVSFGLNLQKHGSGISITGMSSAGLFGAEEYQDTLQLGQRVMFVNSLPCPSSTPELIKQLQRAYPMVTLECQDVDVGGVGTSGPVEANADVEQKQVYDPVLNPDQIVAEIVKPSPDATLGLSLRKSVQINSILIAGINADSLSSGKGLVVGQKIVSINGMPCPTTTIATIKMLKESTNIQLAVAEIDWSATFLSAETRKKKRGKKGVEIRLPPPAMALTTEQEHHPPAPPDAVIPMEISIGNGGESASPSKETKDDSLTANTTQEDDLDLVRKEEEANELADLLNDFEAQLQNVYKEAAASDDEFSFNSDVDVKETNGKTAAADFGNSSSAINEAAQAIAKVD